MFSTAPARPSRDARPVLLFFICLTVLALIAQTWWAIVQDRQLTIESETHSGLATVRSLEQHTSRVLEEVEHLLSEASNQIRDMDAASTAAPIHLQRLLASQRDTLRSVATMWIVGPD